MPVLPSIFINIISVKSIEKLAIVENYLSGINKYDPVNNKEELVS